eukprot:247817-Pelagomonas_calceolata.AAC.3
MKDCIECNFLAVRLGRLSTRSSCWLFASGQGGHAVWGTAAEAANKQLASHLQMPGKPLLRVLYNTNGDLLQSAPTVQACSPPSKREAHCGPKPRFEKLANTLVQWKDTWCQVQPMAWNST